MTPHEIVGARVVLEPTCPPDRVYLVGPPSCLIARTQEDLARALHQYGRLTVSSEGYVVADLW